MTCNSVVRSSESCLECPQADRFTYTGHSRFRMRRRRLRPVPPDRRHPPPGVLCRATRQSALSDMTPPHVAPPQLLDSTCNLLRGFDPEGDAAAHFLPETGQRWGTVQLWPGAELRFWIESRKVRGDLSWRYFDGPLPAGLESERGPQTMEGVRNVAELAFSLLQWVVSALLSKVIDDDAVLESGTDEEIRAAVPPFRRARSIRHTLERNAATHDYEMQLQLALARVTAAMATSQRMAEWAIGIDSGDFTSTTP